MIKGHPGLGSDLLERVGPGKGSHSIYDKTCPRPWIWFGLRAESGTGARHIKLYQGLGLGDSIN